MPTRSPATPATICSTAVPAPTLMLGGFGNDVYFVDNAGDRRSRTPGEGNDTVFSTAHFRLSANVENLVLQGSADLQGYGNGEDNCSSATPATISSTAAPAPTSCSAAPATTRTSSTMPATGGRERRTKATMWCFRRPTSGCRRTWKPWSCKAAPTCRATATASQRDLRQRRQQPARRRGRRRRDVRRRRQRRLLRRQCRRCRVRERRRRHRRGLLDGPLRAVGERGNPGPARQCQPAGLRQQRANTLYGNTGNNLLNGEGGADSCSAAPATTSTSSTTSATSYSRTSTRAPMRYFPRSTTR